MADLDPATFDVDVLATMSAPERVAIVGEVFTPHWSSRRDVQDRLAADPSVAVRRRVASNTGRADLIERLAADEDAKVRQRISSNKVTPSSVLIALATRDPDPSVRIAAALNKRLPDAVRAKVAYDPDDEVARAAIRVARRGVFTTADIDTFLSRLGSTLNAAELERLAANATDADQLRALATMAIRSHQRAREVNVRAYEGMNALLTILSHPRTPTELIRDLVAYSRTAPEVASGFAERAASNRRTPPDVLDELATSDNREARQRVANNPSTPDHVLEALAGDPDADVARAAWQRRQTVEGNVEVIYALAGHKTPSPDVLTVLLACADEVKGYGRKTAELDAIRYRTIDEVRTAFRVPTTPHPTDDDYPAHSNDVQQAVARWLHANTTPGRPVGREGDPRRP